MYEKMRAWALTHADSIGSGIAEAYHCEAARRNSMGDASWKKGHGWRSVSEPMKSTRPSGENSLPSDASVPKMAGPNLAAAGRSYFSDIW